MKRFLICALAMLLCISGIAHAETYTVVFATDPHYLSPALVEDQARFLSTVETGDGKLTHYTPQITAAFVDEMRRLAPNAVIISGDLTLNGAAESHAEYAAALLELQAAGIPVLVLPGNHDARGTAYRFTKAGVEEIEGYLDAQFAELYEPLGMASALSRDSVSHSYTAEIAPGLIALLIDVNANGTFGTIREETLAWAEEQLQQAQSAGARVIGVSHQNLLVHHPMYRFGYQVNNAQALTKLYEQYGVTLHLSGHLHIQHIAQSGTLTEIAGVSLAVSPNAYGVIAWDGEALSYQSQPLDVAGWAARTGQTDPNLLDFAAYSAKFFDDTTRDSLERQIAVLEIDDDTKQQMLDFAMTLNAQYFAGARVTAPDPTGLALWKEHLPDTFFSVYMESIVAEGAAEMRVWN
ncbi:MAG: metallophosphoesterase [Oscillospiraceae bacterium]|jgi:3',5'-cyclic AMP phosphodiesterase CpdA|nr:metallophosphoesterase [Oscillospiraceae bacterium]